MNVNIQQIESGEIYSCASRYVCKTDTNVYQGSGHPPLEKLGSPRTKKCITALKSKSRGAGALSGGESTSLTTLSTGESGQKQRTIGKLTPLDVGIFAAKQNIKKETEVFAAANARRLERKNNLADYVIRNSKRLTDIIHSTWKLEQSRSQLSNKLIPRMVRVHDLAEGSCKKDKGGRWLQLALETLRRNKINKYVCAGALRELLKKGRGEHRNIIFVWPEDSGKTFMFQPPTNDLFMNQQKELFFTQMNLFKN